MATEAELIAEAQAEAQAEAALQAERALNTPTGPMTSPFLGHDISGIQPPGGEDYPLTKDSAATGLEVGGSVLGSIIGAALAPETGGLSLLIPAVTGAGGGFLGKQFAREAGLREDKASSADLGQAAAEAAAGAVIPGAFKLIGGGLSSVATGFGNVAKRYATQIDDFLDPVKAIGRSLTQKTKDYLPSIEGKNILTAVANLKDELFKRSPDKANKVFGALYDDVAGDGGLINQIGTQIDDAIAQGTKILESQGKGSIPLKDLDFSSITSRTEGLFPEVSKKVARRVFEEEYDNIASQVLGPDDFRKYKEAQRILGNYDKKSDRLFFYDQSKSPARTLSKSAPPEVKNAGYYVLEAQKRIDNHPFTVDDIVNFKRRFEDFGKYEKALLGSDELTSAEVYRELATSFREKLGEVIGKADPELGLQLRNLNSYFGNLKRIEPLLDVRAAEELMGSSSLGSPISGFRSLLGGIEASPIQNYRIGTRSGTSMPAVLGATGQISSAVGSLAQAGGWVGRRVTDVFGDPRVMAGIVQYLAPDEAQALQDASTKNVALQREVLNQVTTNHPELFEPSPLPGYNVVDGRINDPFQRFSYSEELRERERAEGKSYTEHLHQLNLDGTVLELKENALTQGTTVSLKSPGESATLEKTNSKALGDAERQVPNY